MRKLQNCCCSSLSLKKKMFDQVMVDSARYLCHLFVESLCRGSL